MSNDYYKEVVCSDTRWTDLYEILGRREMHRASFGEMSNQLRILDIGSASGLVTEQIFNFYKPAYLLSLEPVREEHKRLKELSNQEKYKNWYTQNISIEGFIRHPKFETDFDMIFMLGVYQKLSPTKKDKILGALLEKKPAFVVMRWPIKTSTSQPFLTATNKNYSVHIYKGNKGQGEIVVMENLEC